MFSVVVVVLDSEEDFYEGEDSDEHETPLQRGGWSAATLKVLSSMPSRTAGKRKREFWSVFS